MKGTGAGSGRSAWCYLKLIRYAIRAIPVQMHPETEGQMDV